MFKLRLDEHTSIEIESLSEDENQLKGQRISDTIIHSNEKSDTDFPSDSLKIVPSGRNQTQFTAQENTSIKGKKNR